MRKILSILFFSIALLQAQAQQDSISWQMSIDPVDIYGEQDVIRNGLEVPFKADSALQKLNLSGSISTTLQYSTPVFVRSNGTNGATQSVSLRGAGADHTVVYWNGFALNSMTLGSADLSLVSNIAADKITVNTGALATGYGTATAGGSIDLHSDYNFTHTENLLNTTVGSFGALGIAAKTKQVLYKGKVKLQAGAFRNTSTNDFTYTDNKQIPFREKVAIHNENLVEGFIVGAKVILSKKWYTEAGLWVQNNDKNLPLQYGQNGKSYQEQYNHSVKQYAKLGYVAANYRLELRQAYFTDNLRYTDKTTEDGPYTVESIIPQSRSFNELHFRINLSKELTYSTSISANQIGAETKNFGGKGDEDQYWNYHHLVYAKNKVKLLGGLRLDKRYGTELKILKSISAAYYIPKIKTTIGIQIDDKFRAPDLNEKYWTPGGNPNLENEYGLNKELNIRYQLSKETIELLATAEVYQNNINNWIQWQPTNMGYWAPSAYKSVSLSGGVLNVTAHKIFAQNWTVGLNTTYSYTKAINNSFIDGLGGKRVNKQVVYIPIAQTKAILNLKYKTATLFGGINYTGEQYKDERYVANSIHPAFTTLLAGLSYNCQVKKLGISLAGTVNNLANLAYESVPGYIMPGRNFQLSITIKHP